MLLHGAHIIAGEPIQTSGETFQATDPSTGELLGPGFCEGSEDDVHRALECAQAAAPVYAACTFSSATSVGGAAIKRFARPLSYQDFPDSALPEALQEAKTAWHNTPRGWGMGKERMGGWAYGSVGVVSF